MKLFNRKKEEPRTFEGRFITDEEIFKIVRTDQPSFILKELNELNDMVEKMKNYDR